MKVALVTVSIVAGALFGFLGGCGRDEAQPRFTLTPDQPHPAYDDVLLTTINYMGRSIPCAVNKLGGMSCWWSAPA